jgi:hypothetical protein
MTLDPRLCCLLYASQELQERLMYTINRSCPFVWRYMLWELNVSLQLTSILISIIWSLRVHVLCPLCPFMCLPVSRLFWVSSLAYPKLLGTKGYVVVVESSCVAFICWLPANHVISCFGRHPNCGSAVHLRTVSLSGLSSNIYWRSSSLESPWMDSFIWKVFGLHEYPSCKKHYPVFLMRLYLDYATTYKWFTFSLFCYSWLIWPYSWNYMHFY